MNGKVPTRIGDVMILTRAGGGSMSRLVEYLAMVNKISAIQEV